MARIYAQAGEEEKAVDTLESLLSLPAGLLMSRELLRIDPLWDPLRKNPRFKKLLEEPHQ
jgi:serine/threonine-protein kinase